VVAAVGSSGVSNLSGFNQLPDTQGMVATSGSTNSLVRALSTTTPPTLGQLAMGEVSVDDTFFNGRIADLIATPPTGPEDAVCQGQNPFWGDLTSDSAVAGQAGCMMTQQVGQTFSTLVEGGSSLCYMKNMPTAAGIEITGFSGDASDIFSQQPTDQLVRVHVSNLASENPEEPSEQYVNIKVLGSNTVGSDTYKAILYFCADTSSSSAATGFESFEVNKTTGSFTTQSVGNEGSGGAHSLTSSAFIKEDSAGNIVFDLTQDRSASVTASWTDGIFKGDISISGEDIITAKTFDKNTYYDPNNNSQINYRKAYAVSLISGDSLDNVKFIEGAYKDLNLDGDLNPQGFGGLKAAIEYSSPAGDDNNFYNAAPNNSLLSSLPEDFSDPFYDELADPVIDTSDYDCEATADATVEMDFALAGIAAIGELCDSGTDHHFDYCWTGDLGTAELTFRGACYSEI